MKIVIELFIIFLIVTLLMFLILKRLADKRRMKDRIKEFLPSHQVESTVDQVKKTTFLKQFFLNMSTMFKNVRFSDSTAKVLLESGSKLKPEEFLALRILTAAGLGIVTGLIKLPWFLAILAAFIGFVLPKISLKRKRKKRLSRINYQLIEVLGMMANSMRAGFSFMQAMQLVGKEVSDPLGPEFDRVVRQSGLGIPLDDVFEELVERLPNKELEVVVRAILAQRKSGGNLAELLETMEETIRGRVRILEELHTLTAQGRMSSWIITLLPVALGLYLSLVNKEYFSPMLHHPLGWVMLSAASVSILIGWAIIQKIIRIEV
ncbi:type II secretion system F family protein [Neobacillus bataviensis]|uniref:type II secretion system F family protein n=1 Tax=Neobacillus bataviensis TaxID=220685 RepID=UPI001CBD3E60|nr:type II secretion system F family protein [Neobacillus bataviensis]